MAIASAYQDNNGMTLNMRLFCEHYLSNGFKKMEAIKSAYGNNKSDGVCAAMASENLKKPCIKNYLEKRVKEITDKIGFNAEYRLKKLKIGTDLSIPDILESDSLEEKMAKMKFADVRAGVACIAETNKMEGAYAPTQKQRLVLIIRLRWKT